MSRTAFLSTRASATTLSNAHIARQSLAVVAFALLTALASQVALPLPHTPVPITLQTLVVVLAGTLIGGRLGSLSMGLYLLLGVCGYLVFAENRWGFETVLGATGGYLVGFMLAQPVIAGLLARCAAWPRMLGALLAAHGVIFACGLVCLAAVLQTGIAETLKLGLWPFLPGMVLKTAAALAIALPLRSRVRRWLGL